MTSPRVCRFAVALLLGVIFVAGVYGAVRLRALYAVQLEVARIQAERKDNIVKFIETANRIEARIDQVERILFGDVITQLDKQSKVQKVPSWIEQWQKNRDKELRERIMLLERRLYRLEQ